MIVVVGASGQLGFELRRQITSDAVFLGRPEFDLDNLDQATKSIELLKPSLLINATAYNQVDKAENETQKARHINVEAPARLAEVARKLSSRMIHVSTDYVFDGTSTTPYKETDVTHPLGAYGQSKLNGEKAVLANHPQALVVRTSWLYSSHGQNFVKTVIRLDQEKKNMRVVNDQIGSPTWAKDLAAALLKGRDLAGLFHYSNEGAVSRYDFACAVKKLKNLNLAIEPIATSEYPTPAKRPHYSVLNTNKIKSALNISIPHWMESLEKCLNEQS